MLMSLYVCFSLPMEMCSEPSMGRMIRQETEIVMRRKAAISVGALATAHVHRLPLGSPDRTLLAQTRDVAVMLVDVANYLYLDKMLRRLRRDR